MAFLRSEGWRPRPIGIFRVHDLKNFNSVSIPEGCQPLNFQPNPDQILVLVEKGNLKVTIFDNGRTSKRQICPEDGFFLIPPGLAYEISSGAGSDFKYKVLRS